MSRDLRLRVRLRLHRSDWLHMSLDFGFLGEGLASLFFLSLESQDGNCDRDKGRQEGEPIADAKTRLDAAATDRFINEELGLTGKAALSTARITVDSRQPTSPHDEKTEEADNNAGDPQDEAEVDLLLGVKMSNGRWVDSLDVPRRLRSRPRRAAGERNDG